MPTQNAVGMAPGTWHLAGFGETMAKSKSIPEDEWTEWWDARVAAMESVLGPCDDIVGHAAIPFDIGADNGGGADIIYFKKHVSGIVSVTSELIGRDDQVEGCSRFSIDNYAAKRTLLSRGMAQLPRFGLA